MKSLVGTYTLISWENRHASGKTSYPLGPDAKGMLHYSENGYMYVHIMAADRNHYTGEDMFGGKPDEIVSGATSHISYCARYRIENDEVIHKVLICSFPNWISTELRRKFSFENGNLQLSAQGLQVGAESVDAYLIWRPVRR